jgi:hypothetical protein
MLHYINVVRRITGPECGELFAKRVATVRLFATCVTKRPKFRLAIQSFIGLCAVMEPRHFKLRSAAFYHIVGSAKPTAHFKGLLGAVHNRSLLPRSGRAVVKRRRR